MQAKRYEEGNNVGRPDLQKFVGSLSGRNATKGVFFTTSDFTADALSYLETVREKIVCVNRERLLNLLIENKVGEELTVDLSSITDSNGLPDSADDYTYQWVLTKDESDTNIATSSSYTLTEDDIGATITVVVSFSDDDGFSEGPLTSAVTKTVIAASAVAGEIWTGTVDDDVKDGTAGDDTLDGGAGNDTINGLAGNDVINGGAGNDTINGGAGNDTIDGGAGGDAIDGGEGIDYIIDNGSRAEDFMLRIDLGEGHYDVVAYYKNSLDIVIDTVSGVRESTEQIMADAEIRWTHEDASSLSAAAGSSTNDSSTLDTVIYHTNGTVNDTSDDWVLMVLEDYQASLTTGQFDIV